MCECEREKERKNRETDRGGGGGAERGVWLCTIGLDMNAPRHSFPHIPFNFNSLMELAILGTHSHCAQRTGVCAHTVTAAHTSRDTNVYEHALVTYAHTQKTQAHAVME